MKLTGPQRFILLRGNFSSVEPGWTVAVDTQMLARVVCEHDAGVVVDFGDGIETEIDFSDIAGVIRGPE